MDIQRKMELYKSMFYCNVRGDRDPNYIKADSLRIELIAGGLNWQQQDYVMDKMQPNEWREVSTILSYRYKKSNITNFQGLINAKRFIIFLRQW